MNETTEILQGLNATPITPDPNSGYLQVRSVMMVPWTDEQLSEGYSGDVLEQMEEAGLITLKREKVTYPKPYGAAEPISAEWYARLTEMGRRMLSD